MGLANGNISLPPSMFLQDRKLQGCSMGSVQFRKDLPFFIDLYMDGRLKLDELVSSRITLDQINEGYAAITDGSIARTVVVFD
jgi:S-(hydroxymethyl)glutathione dehydrogenase/alcohol dehydrogenase